MTSWKSSLGRWNRILHRNLGFFTVGLCLVYGTSGFLLNHMNGKDPAYRTRQETVTFPAGVRMNELASLWRERGDALPALKKVVPVDSLHYRLMLEGGIGFYSAQTGIADYESYKRNDLVYWINRLHYNKLKGWSPVADFFAFSLVFFAISGLFMVKGRNGIGRRGKWYLLAGLAVPILYILLS